MSQLNSKMDFDELLTPYVQGNLDEEQRKYVEERTQSDRGCNEKLKFEQQIVNSIKQSSEKFQEITPSFDALQERINNSSGKYNWWNIFSKNFGDISSWFNPGLVLASCAAICLGVYMLFSQQAENNLLNDYETLSSGDSSVVYSSEKQYLRVIIATQKNERQVQSLADEFSFTIESGPDSLNSYIVSFSKGHSLSEETLASWRNDPRFDLVEPIPTVELEYY
ncbi:MAG: hypothetical protein ACR2PU_04900 [Gammaproteobacteria bacterium]